MSKTVPMSAFSAMLTVEDGASCSHGSAQRGETGPLNDLSQ
ncbi:hypothetical protein ACIQMR_31595 [Streptomyces sp. NPDC091376]